MAVHTMGVINVTPDSFVGDVRTPGTDDAIDRCHALVAQGATILDIGGESTRPGADAVSIDEELARVVPVIEAIAPALPDGVRISIDTRNEPVARHAVTAGATIINDMSATLGEVAGRLGVGYVAAHMQGTPEKMQMNPRYDDVVAEVLDTVVAAADIALAAGAAATWIDPGIGFGKTHSHNLTLLAHIDRFVATDHRVLVGVSRKSLTGAIHGASDQQTTLEQAAPTATDDRLEASVAIATWCALSGVDIVRVHDVDQTVRAMKVASRLVGRGPKL